MDPQYLQADGAPQLYAGRVRESRPNERFRVPKVNEALPFTPFTSIMPFNPEIIPPPLALPVPAPMPTAHDADSQNIRQVLDQLTSNASSAEQASQRCRATLRDVQKLLDPQNLTQFRFKAPRHRWQSNDMPVPVVKPELSAFANLVYNSSNVEFLQGSSHAPRSRVKIERPIHKNSSQVRQKSIVDIPIVKKDSPAIVKKSPIETPDHPMVVVRQPQPVKHASVEVEIINHHQPNGFMNHSTASNTNPSKINSHRSKANVAMQNLQSLLCDIFEAEDGLQADTSGKASKAGSDIFSTRAPEGNSAPMLQPDWQIKLDSCIHKAVTNNSLEGIEIDHLVRVQRICESAVAFSDSIDLHFEDDWPEDRLEEWLDSVASLEQSLVAAMTLLRIMSAGAQLKELQSEDYVRAVLATLKAAVEDLLIPLVEQRTTRDKARNTDDQAGSTATTSISGKYRKQLQGLLNTSTKAYRALGGFLTQTVVDESTISVVEYLSKTLIFAENVASEKDSILGLQAFEVTRRCAMDVLAKIFVKYTSQRQYIIDEILISLEKLPATKQSARQFRLADGKPIQLVSALLMRLVQTSATYTAESEAALAMPDGAESDGMDQSHSENDSDGSSEYSSDNNTTKRKRKSKKQAPEGLAGVAQPLHDTAQANVSYIVKFLIRRALTTSKSSDEPFRRLLDIFTVDFLEVLGSDEWPAAEMMLRTLVSHMIALAENPKSTAASRIMALELIGTIGSGILQLQLLARAAVRGLNTDTTPVSQQLREHVACLETGELPFDSLAAFDGPYRMIIESLQSKSTDNAQVQSAMGYYLMEWAWLFCEERPHLKDAESLEDSLRSSEQLRDILRNMIADNHWLEQHHEAISIENREGRLAAIVLMLSSKLCKAFNRMFSILLNSMSSEQPAIRNRGLKSVAALLETDPSILDRNSFILKHISRCADDSSPLVRASALGLYEKCTSLRPSLDERVYARIVERTRDANVGIRKQAIVQIKKFYLRNESAEMRSNIASAIIARIDDHDEGVRSLARLTMEEIWFQPLYSDASDSENTIATKLKYGAQAALMIQTVQLGPDVVKVLESLLKELLSQSKNSQSNLKVCRMLIRIQFDAIVDDSEIPGSLDQKAILHSVTVFAKTCPQLFTAMQLERLEPYVKSLTQEDDFAVYRSAICILRHTLPCQTALRPDYLSSLQTALMVAVQKLRKAELEEVVSCLWTISTMHNNVERLANLVRSALANICAMSTEKLADDTQKMSRLTRLMVIVGEFGKTCDFDKELASFKAKFPDFKGSTCSDLLVDKLCPFTSPRQPSQIRECAFDAVCSIAQEWPKVFLRADVVNAFELVFTRREVHLEEVILSGLESFYRMEDENPLGEDVPELGSGVASGTERLGRTYVATDRDGASTSIAQRFLPQILRIALASFDEVAFIAARLVVNINKHSLVLPKQSAPALVALETCPNTQIANLAFREHKDQHTKRESLFEKEYMRAIDQVYQYQRDVAQDTKGYTGQPPVAKMHLLWEVLRGGKSQTRKKFLGNMAAKLNFDLSSIKSDGGKDQMLFVRFCTENMALFEYDKMEDIAHLITQLEKTVSGIGTTIAQAIESEILKLQVDPNESTADHTQDLVGEGIRADRIAVVTSGRLYQLATAAQMCSLTWETRTFIRRLWNMNKYMTKIKETKEKEVQRAPSRIPNPSAAVEAYLRRVDAIAEAIDSEQGQHSICRSFVDMINVDSEVKVADDDNDMKMLEGDDGTPSVGRGSRSPSAAPGSQGKKRRMSSNAGTPRKRSKSYNARRSSGGAKEDDDDDDGGWD